MSDETTAVDAAVKRAGEIGADKGRDAAGWVFDGNTSAETYQRVLTGIQDGDPEVMDAYRAPDLSGEFADEYSEANLRSDLGIPDCGACDAGECDEPAHAMDDAANAYNDAASSAFWAEVERVALYHVG